MHMLAELLTERISAGFRRRSLTTPSRYAEAVRIMGKPFPGPWTFKWHPWLREMHDSVAESNVGQKSAQMGFTETLLNIVFFKIDVEGVDCLYVLPAKTPDAGDFSAGRFDPALELSPHLSKMFSDVKNIGHKRAGSTNLYVRGSKSRAGLKSIPVGFIVLDEVDEFKQENIPLALERGSGQQTKQDWKISTPTINNRGINKFFNQSTQELFHFKCPSCSRFTFLSFPECMEITGSSFDDQSLSNSYLKCKECQTKLLHEAKPQWLKNGIWIKQQEHAIIRGFHINQLYSPTVTPLELATHYLRSLIDKADEQSFWNDKIGVPHMVEGARLTDHQLDSCKGDYQNANYKGYMPIITMGIDVGKFLHYEVDAWFPPKAITKSVDLNVESQIKVIEYGKVTEFEQLDELMQKYRVNACVIDAHPERRKAFEFASRFFGHVKMCIYGAGIHGKQIHAHNVQNTNEPLITVDRTSWLDLSLGRFRNSSITLPQNFDIEYREQLKALVRVYEKDKDGNSIGRYQKAESTEDHYAHARNYAEMALPFAAQIATPQNIKSPF